MPSRGRGEEGGGVAENIGYNRHIRLRAKISDLISFKVF